MALTCAQGGACSVGEVGPGGGRVFFYASSGFNCGATHTSTGSPTGGLCKYLEVAPSGWNTGSDPTKPWAVSANQSSDISGITNEATAYNNTLGVGLGYKNSSLIVTLNGMYNASTNNYAAGAARAYSGGTKSDWYLPTLAELNLLCQWAHGVAPSVGTACTGGSINSSIYGANSAGFAANGYWSSSELSTTNAWAVAFGSPFQGDGGKNLAISVRPIRAF